MKHKHQNALLMKKKFKFIGLYQGLIFIPWALSGFLMGLVWKWIFDESFGVLNDALLKLGLIDTRIPWLSNGNWGMAAVIIANIWYGVTFFCHHDFGGIARCPHRDARSG